MTEKKTNWIKYLILGVVILAVGSYIAFNLFPKQVKEVLGQSFVPGRITIIGSASNLIPVPTNNYINVDVGSTTDTTYGTATTGTSTIQQLINTTGISEGLLCWRANATNTTTTLNIKQMGSYDGINYFNVGSSTDEIGASFTSSVAKALVTFDPGLATTTGDCKVVSVKGYKFIRFMPMAEDVAADSGDGFLQAWITFDILDELVR